VIALVDYGAGNLTSVRKALTAVGAEFYTPAGPVELAQAAGVIVPGVGHFGSTRTLDQPWRHAILERLDAGRPLLGICVGSLPASPMAHMSTSRTRMRRRSRAAPWP